jgi:hypothetical protein
MIISQVRNVGTTPLRSVSYIRKRRAEGGVSSAIRRSTRVSPRSRYTSSNCYEPEKPSRGSSGENNGWSRHRKVKRRFSSRALTQTRKGGPLPWVSRSLSILVQILAQSLHVAMTQLREHHWTQRTKTPSASTILLVKSIRPQNSRYLTKLGR